MQSTIIRPALRAAFSVRSRLALHARQQPRHGFLYQQTASISSRYSSNSYLPMILQPAFWRSIIPRALRSSSVDDVEAPKSKDWNPATFFIVIFLLIGSQSIQMIALERSYTNFSNETNAKLSLLRDVLRRVQAGEDVDVEKEMGTGDEVKEKEWEEVMRELAKEDAMIQSRNQRRRAKEAAKREAAQGSGSV